jgi:hypothetical protein
LGKETTNGRAFHLIKLYQIILDSRRAYGLELPFYRLFRGKIILTDLQFSLLHRPKDRAILQQPSVGGKAKFFENKQSAFSPNRVCDPLPISLGLGLGLGDPWVAQAWPKGHPRVAQGPSLGEIE